MARFQFSKYCTPAQLYLVVAGIGLLAAAIRKFRALTLLANGILVLVWTWILNLLCRKGLTAISWILVLLPFVFMASSYFLAMDAADAKIVEGSEVMSKFDSDTVGSSAGLEFEAPTAAGGDIPTLPTASGTIPTASGVLSTTATPTAAKFNALSIATPTAAPTAASDLNVDANNWSFSKPASATPASGPDTLKLASGSADTVSGTGFMPGTRADTWRF